MLILLQVCLKILKNYTKQDKIILKNYTKSAFPILKKCIKYAIVILDWRALYVF